MIQELLAVDLLATLPEIDTERIGFVGWSHGAGLGTLLAGIEDRIKAYALIGVGNTTTYGPEARTWLKVPKGAAFTRWAAWVSVIDSLTYVRHNKTAAFLFLNGRHEGRVRGERRAAKRSAYFVAGLVPVAVVDGLYQPFEGIVFKDGTPGRSQPSRSRRPPPGQSGSCDGVPDET